MQFKDADNQADDFIALSPLLCAASLLQDGLEVKQKDSEMKRVLGLFELSAFGISAIIGGGIFVVTGQFLSPAHVS